MATAERTPVAVVIPLVAGNCRAVSSVPLAPLIVGALVSHLGFTEAVAAMMLTVEFLSIAAASLLIAPFASCIDRRLAAFAASAVIIAGSVLSMAAHTATGLVPARVLTGLGEGVLAATISAAAAGTPAPQRLFALLGLSIGLYAMLVLLVVPWQIQRFGVAGLFGIIVVVGLLVLPLLKDFPARAVASLRVDPARLPKATLRLALVGLAALLLLAAGQSSIAAYLERVGTALGMSGQAIGNALALAALASLAGPAAAHVLGDRFGHGLPWMAGGAVLCASSLTIGYAGTALPYTVAAVGTMTGVLFLMPYVMGLYATLDASGRVAAAGPAFGTFGGAIGPALGAAILALGFDYAGVAWLSVAAYALAITMFSAILRRVARGADAASMHRDAAGTAGSGPTPPAWPAAAGPGEASRAPSCTRFDQSE
jgi:predicted MFS family arabinose efflux permease